MDHRTRHELIAVGGGRVLDW